MITTTTPKFVTRKLRVAEAVNHLITVQSAANQEFWDRPVEEILAELNLDVAESLELLAGNTTLASALNTTQGTLNVIDEQGSPVFPARAPTEPGRADIVFDGAAFVFTPAAEPEPEPAP